MTMERFTQNVAIGTILSFFMGMDEALKCLILLMILDYASGVFNAVREKKLSSSVGFVGITKKMTILIVVGTALIVDGFIKANQIIYHAAIAFYIANEGISILENSKKMGLPIPNKISDVLEQIREEDKDGLGNSSEGETGAEISTKSDGRSTSTEQ